jgi:hypothetical protein
MMIILARMFKEWKIQIWSFFSMVERRCSHEEFKRELSMKGEPRYLVGREWI